MSVTCEKDAKNLKNPVTPSPTASGSSRESFVNPFKRKFLDMHDNGEKLAEPFASLSPEQKKAFKDAVL